MECVEITCALYKESRLPLVFSQCSPGCLNNRGRGAEEALAVGGALVSNFDGGSFIHLLVKDTIAAVAARARVSVRVSFRCRLCKMQRWPITRDLQGFRRHARTLSYTNT